MSHCPLVSSQVTQGQTGRPQGSIHFQEGDGCIGRATTRAHPPHPLPARPYYTANRPAPPVYSRGRGGCGRGDGALVAARPCPPPLFSLFASVHLSNVIIQGAYLPKNRWVNVAMKLISINRPVTASNAASAVTGLLRAKGPGRKPRP